MAESISAQENDANQILDKFEFSAYGRELVDKLASENFQGRGYVKDGVNKAADFLIKEFKDLGLQALEINQSQKGFQASYFQQFYTPVNSFPKKVTCQWENLKLVPGKDFQVQASSPGIKGDFEVYLVDLNELLSKRALDSLMAQPIFLAVRNSDLSSLDEDEYIAVQGLLNQLHQSPGNYLGVVIFQEEKLTWSGSIIVDQKPLINILEKDELSASLNGNRKHFRIKLNIDQTFHDSYPCRNIMGKLPGKGNTGKSIVIAGHYDHLGMMGKKALYPGANDNASGTAMVLSLAKFYKTYPEFRPEHDLIFILFAAEEIGLIGSFAFTDANIVDPHSIVFMLNFDICGTGDEGIQIVNSKYYPEQFDELVSINEQHQLLKDIRKRGKSCNSDHCPFDLQNVPSFFFYTLGGVRHYHDIYDRAATLPLTKFNDFSNLIIRFIATLNPDG